MYIQQARLNVYTTSYQMTHDQFMKYKCLKMCTFMLLGNNTQKKRSLKQYTQKMLDSAVLYIEYLQYISKKRVGNACNSVK
jgi:hypothetical protein